MKVCLHCNGTGVEPDHQNIGAGLRTLRQSCDLTLRQMAETIGVSHSFLSQLENGRRAWKRSVKKRYEEAVKKHQTKNK